MVEQLELKDRARKFYAENPSATIKDVADEFSIPYETARDWAQTYSWTAERRRVGFGSPDDIIDQAAGIRDVLYTQIVYGANSADDLVELVKAWKSTTAIQRAPEKEDEYDQNDLLSIIHETD